MDGTTGSTACDDDPTPTLAVPGFSSCDAAFKCVGLVVVLAVVVSDVPVVPVGGGFFFFGRRFRCGSCVDVAVAVAAVVVVVVVVVEFDTEVAIASVIPTSGCVFVNDSMVIRT